MGERFPAERHVGNLRVVGAAARQRSRRSLRQPYITDMRRQYRFNRPVTDTRYAGRNSLSSLIVIYTTI